MIVFMLAMLMGNAVVPRFDTKRVCLDILLRLELSDSELVL